MCKLCDGENNFQPLNQAEIDEVDLALRNEKSRMRYYLDLNTKLTGGKHENIEESLAVYQPA
jgi:hypothetical protein